jgi:predicted transposase YdaD
LKGPTLDYRYKILDIRELEPEELLDSSFATDNVLAILTRLKSRKESIRRILARIAKLERGPREIAFSKLLILAGLRELEDSVRAEAQSMPIMHDIMDHKVIGPAIRQGLKQGRQEGRHEGEVTILHRLIVKRFGTLPSWAEKQLHEMSTEALEDLSPRVLDAKTLDELFGR